MNKKGTEKYLSVWWFVSVGLVAGVIVIIIAAFYSAELDIKETEAEILGEVILDCIVENGFLVEGILDEEFDIFNQCQISKEAIEGSFYFLLSFVSEGQELRENIVGGDTSFAANCEILRSKGGREVEAEAFPNCVSRVVNANMVNGEEIGVVEISILSASNQRGREVPVV